MLAFSRRERLKAARRIIAFAQANPHRRPSDLPVIEDFIKNNEERIEAERNSLWPEHKGQVRSLVGD